MHQLRGVITKVNIDIHSHFIPKEFIELVKGGYPGLKVKITDKSGTHFMQHEQGYVYPLHKGFYDNDYRLEEMEKARIDRAVLSAAPPLFYYDADEAVVCKVARTINDGIANAVSAYPDKFIGVANVPLQYVDRATEELEYANKKLGFSAVHIGTNIEGKQLDAPELLPFFAKAEELGMLIIAHPYYVGEKNALEKYYLTNLIGNPLDTTLAITHLIFGGVLDKHPKLKFCFVHGGGFLPYQIGRLEHGYRVRKEPKAFGAKSPASYMSQLYFDTILFNEKALRYLIDAAGSDHVVMGTDYPFDMGESDPVNYIETSITDTSTRDAILGNNVARLLKL